MYVFVICVQTISTTYRRGKTWKSRGGMSLCQSTSLPSLAHSRAQTSATSSGIGF
jgi:hypothetical protein